MGSRQRGTPLESGTEADSTDWRSNEAETPCCYRTSWCSGWAPPRPRYPTSRQCRRQ